MKYVIEFDLPDNDTVLNNIKTDLVGWNVWGYSGSAFAKPKQPERKTGKWIPAFDGKFKGGAYWFNCSKCGHMVAGVMSIKRFNYCPNCGFKMEGAEPEDIPMEYFESGGR